MNRQAIQEEIQRRQKLVDDCAAWNFMSFCNRIGVLENWDGKTPIGLDGKPLIPDQHGIIDLDSVLKHP